MANPIPTGLRDFINREKQLPASPVIPLSEAQKAQVALQGGSQVQRFDDRGALVVSENSVNINATSFVTTTASLLALANNPTRKYLLIQNNGADFFVMNFGNQATLLLGIKLAANAVYEMLRPSIQDIYIIGNSAGINVSILEGT